MGNSVRICAVIPVFNHALTVRQVVLGAKDKLPVIVVDDGSTDATAEALKKIPALTLLTHKENKGKAEALRTGFARAREAGFSHAVTLDADGQHPITALDDFMEVCRHYPGAFVIGVRDLRAAGAPFYRRVSNMLSTLCFKMETGVSLADTQCGYRVYPLALLAAISVKADRYAYELEIMVKAAWAGIPLVPCPVEADYSAPTSRMSHFRPLADFASACRVHSRLAAQAFFGLRRSRQLAPQI